MANGDNKNFATLIAEMVLKQGSWAVLSAVLLYAFWVVALEPAAKERTIFVDTLRQSSLDNRESVRVNCETMKDMQKTNVEIRKSVAAQQSTLLDIQQELISQSELRRVAMKTMSAFASDVQEEHPRQMEKLDKILEQVEQ